ncbi:hypothetical protein [Nocardioides dongkuii]|nr:hypothetical protein [Nocardioides dongkuii]
MRPGGVGDEARDREFGEYAAARWPRLVRAAVPLGSPVQVLLAGP